MIKITPKEVLLLMRLYTMKSFSPSNKLTIAKKLCNSDGKWNDSTMRFINKMINYGCLVKSNQSVDIERSVKYDRNKMMIENMWRQTPYFLLSLKVIESCADRWGWLFWRKSKIKQLMYD